MTVDRLVQLGTQILETVRADMRFRHGIFGESVGEYGLLGCSFRGVYAFYGNNFGCLGLKAFCLIW